MKKSILYSLLFCLTSFIGIALYSCGDGTVTVDPASGSTISLSQKITITFPGSVDQATLVLSGTMVDESDGGVWDGNKLTFSPTDIWDGGAPGTLTVKATGTDDVVLDYNFELTFSTFQRATVVIGQEDFSGNDSNQGGATGLRTLNGPYGMVAVVDGALFITDTENSRVLKFNNIPTEHNKPANVVLGQPDFVTTNTGDGSNDFDRPEGVLAFEGKLFVKDYDNNRIVVFNEIPTTNQKAANFVIGQDDFNDNSGNCNSRILAGPEGFFITPDGKLLVADSDHNRVLIWNEIPTSSGEPADIVLGQGSFSHCIDNDADQDDVSDANPSSKTLNYPSGVWSDGKKVVVTDGDNNRVLIWNTFPTENFQRADVVLGQEDFSGDTENDNNQDGAADSNPSAKTLSFPYYLHSNGNQLFIEDNGNNRILIWNEFPTENFEKADVVLGQGSFSKNAANDNDQDGSSGAATSRTLNSPSGIIVYGNKLFVSDNSNSRVLIFEAE